MEIKAGQSVIITNVTQERNRNLVGKMVVVDSIDDECVYYREERNDEPTPNAYSTATDTAAFIAAHISQEFGIDDTDRPEYHVPYDYFNSHRSRLRKIKKEHVRPLTQAEKGNRVEYEL